MKTKLIVSIVIIVVVAGIAGGLVWLYSGHFNDAKAAVFKKTGLPAAWSEVQDGTGTSIQSRGAK